MNSASADTGFAAAAAFERHMDRDLHYMKADAISIPRLDEFDDLWVPRWNMMSEFHRRVLDGHHIDGDCLADRRAAWQLLSGRRPGLRGLIFGRSQFHWPPPPTAPGAHFLLEFLTSSPTVDSATGPLHEAPADTVDDAADPHTPSWDDAVADLAGIEREMLAYETDPEALYLRKPLLQDATWPPARRFYQAYTAAFDCRADNRRDPVRLAHLVDDARRHWDDANTAALDVGAGRFTTDERAALRRIEHLVRLLLDGSGTRHELHTARDAIERLMPALPASCGLPLPLRNQLALTQSGAAARVR